MSGSRLGAFGLLAVAGAGILWWLVMALVPPWRAPFHAPDVSAGSFFSLAAADLPLFVGGNGAAGFLLWRRPDSPWTERIVWLALGATLYPTFFVLAETVRTGGAGWAATIAMLMATALVSLVAWSTRAGGDVFEPAGVHSAASHLARTLAYSAFFWGTFLGLGPWLLRLAERGLGIPPLPWTPPLLVCLAVAVPAAALNLWSGVTMARLGEGTPLPQDTARRLVIAGPYRVCRNPMAASGVTMVVVLGLGTRSPLTALAGLGAAIAWHLLARPPEEADLARRFGDDYLHYQREVPLWRLRWPPVSRQG